MGSHHAGRRAAAALLAGVLTTVALSTGLGWLAWGALVPLVVAIDGAPAGVVLAIAVLYTVVLGVGTVAPWLAPAIAAYFGLGLGRALAYTLVPLVAVSAAYGVVLGLLCLARPRRVGVWSVVWWGAAWAAWEALRTIVFPYYPAAVLGVSQQAIPAALQAASVGGIAAVSFVVVAFNAAVASTFSRAPDARRAAAAVIGIGIAVATVAWGRLRLASDADAVAGPRVVAVDVNARTRAAGTLDRYLAASAAATADGPAIVLWPENALTADLEHDPAAWTAVTGFVTAHGATLLTGGPAAALVAGRGVVQFNAARLVAPSAAMQTYRKRGLVPFAERWPGLFGDPPPDLVSLEPGKEPTVLTAGDAAFGVLICFEVTDARAARALVAHGARFLVNLTNDAWFGEAPHLPWAAVRAVETGVPVVRAANAGVSAVFDRFGRRIAARRSADGPSLLPARVPAAVPTIYARAGDAFLAGCIGVVLAGFVSAARTPRRTHRGQSS